MDRSPSLVVNLVEIFSEEFTYKSIKWRWITFDDYGLKPAQFINLIFWKNEKGMQPERKIEPHPFLIFELRELYFPPFTYTSQGW